ncbi:MAG: hypothetical protein ACR2PX_17235 [Endozoicomonas sp.]|uniref:hypothetical protein n=1 Tax=Endozoicomonas sp. TaxID=1892382 RepID=UPI003D9BA45A
MDCADDSGVSLGHSPAGTTTSTPVQEEVLQRVRDEFEEKMPGYRYVVDLSGNTPIPGGLNLDGANIYVFNTVTKRSGGKGPKKKSKGKGKSYPPSRKDPDVKHTPDNDQDDDPTTSRETDQPSPHIQVSSPSPESSSGIPYFHALILPLGLVAIFTGAYHLLPSAKTHWFNVQMNRISENLWSLFASGKKPIESTPQASAHSSGQVGFTKPKPSTTRKPAIQTPPPATKVATPSTEDQRIADELKKNRELKALLDSYPHPVMAELIEALFSVKTMVMDPVIYRRPLSYQKKLDFIHPREFSALASDYHPKDWDAPSKMLHLLPIANIRPFSSLQLSDKMALLNKMSNWVIEVAEFSDEDELDALQSFRWLMLLCGVPGTDIDKRKSICHEKAATLLKTN